MDYRRFQSQAQLACYTNERDAIREYDATTPITTNLMGTFKDLDYFEWAKEMDVVSWDNYPGMDTPPSFTAMCHDLMRGIGGNKPFMLMEQTRTSRTGSRSARSSSRGKCVSSAGRPWPMAPTPCGSSR